MSSIFSRQKIFQKFLSDAVKLVFFYCFLDKRTFCEKRVFALDKIEVWVYNRGRKIRRVCSLKK